MAVSKRSDLWAVLFKHQSYVMGVMDESGIATSQGMAIQPYLKMKTSTITNATAVHWVAKVLCSTPTA
jgi:hypothetical protein